MWNTGENCSCVNGLDRYCCVTIFLWNSFRAFNQMATNKCWGYMFID